MKTNICLLFLIFVTVLILGFSLPTKDITDKFLLDITDNYQCLPVFNYAAKMAAVDLSPYKPGQPKYAHTTFFSSRCTDILTHGNKVFRLFVKEDTPYAYENTQPTGQTIVLETWNAVQLNVQKGNDNAMVRTSDSTFLMPTTPADFFIMYKAGNPGAVTTDSGWIYARISANGKKVIEKGLISSCMGCHGLSKTDRMLGAR